MMAAVADQIEPAAVELMTDEGAHDVLVALASIAISMKRLADHHAAPTGANPAGAFSQHEHNISDVLSDCFHDLAQNIRKD